MNMNFQIHEQKAKLIVSHVRFSMYVARIHAHMFAVYDHFLVILLHA